MLTVGRCVQDMPSTRETGTESCFLPHDRSWTHRRRHSNDLAQPSLIRARGWTDVRGSQGHAMRLGGRSIRRRAGIPAWRSEDRCHAATEYGAGTSFRGDAESARATLSAMLLWRPCIERRGKCPVSS